MSRSDEYAQALRELDQMKADGRIDQAKWEVTRAGLLAEAEKTPRSKFYIAGSIALFFLIVFVVVIVLIRLP